MADLAGQYLSSEEWRRLRHAASSKIRSKFDLTEMHSVELDEPLKSQRHIRLLSVEVPRRLYNITENRPVHVRCIQTLIDDAPDYYALSYPWGDASITRPIFVDKRLRDYMGWGGEERQVGRNLERALASFRNSDPFAHLTSAHGRFIWADALCINQNDPTERASQILLMPEIYRRATRVVVWLSEIDDSRRIKAALDHMVDLERVERAVHEGWYHYYDMPSSKHHGAQSWTKQYFVAVSRQANLAVYRACRNVVVDFVNDLTRNLAPAGDLTRRITRADLAKSYLREVDYALLYEIFRSPWFYRAWINQEIAHAYTADIYIGKYRMRWDTLRRVARVLLDLRAETESGLFQFANGLLRVANIWELVRSPYMPRTLLDVLALCRECNAEDPRDKIYSILSLVESQVAFPVSYTKNWQSVYESFARYWVKTQGTLEILMHCEYKESRDSSLPTWAPDWTDRGFARQLPSTKFRASGTLGPAIHFPKQGIARVKAIVFDKVFDESASRLTPPRYRDMEHYNHRHVSDKVRLAAADAHFLLEAEQIASRAASFGVYSSPLNAFLRSLSGGQASDGSWASTRVLNSPRTISSAHIWYHQRGCNLFSSSFHSNLGPAEQDEIATQWQNMALQNCAGSRFFSTSRGFFGLGPDAARAGNSIAIIQGANVPYVLRDNDDGTYDLLGFCYVDGLMDGEALRMGLEGTCITLR